MLFLNHTFASTAENLALEDALLESCNDGGPEVLRVWTPQEKSVVVGYAQSIQREVNAENCQADGIPILRRISGGGTVLHDAGSLCYALVLRTSREEIASVGAANNWIMNRQAQTVSSPNEAAEVRGHTDLAIGGRKVSGNAQRRKKNAILFHGTLLLSFDFAQIGRYLRFPSQQPDYRAQRNHDEFLTNISLSSQSLIEKLRATWNANDAFPRNEIPRNRVQELVRECYANDEWNFRL